RAARACRPTRSCASGGRPPRPTLARQIGEDRADADARGALGDQREVLLAPRRPRDVEVRPRQVARELLEEERGVDRAGAGRSAVPDGMFSVAAIRPWTSTGDRSCGSAPMIPSTAAAPAMSYFIRSMPSGVLRSSPPESNVMPLPTSATRF